VAATGWRSRTRPGRDARTGCGIPAAMSRSQSTRGADRWATFPSTPSCAEPSTSAVTISASSSSRRCMRRPSARRSAAATTACATPGSAACVRRASRTARRRSTARRGLAHPASTWPRRKRRRLSWRARTPRYGRRTASTRAAASRAGSTADASSTLVGCSSERLCLAVGDLRQSTGTSRFASDPSSDWRNPAAPRTASSAPSASTRVKRRSTSGVNVLAVSR
jgi:hypothetical protein